MTRISTTFPKTRFPKSDTRTVSFVYDDGFGRIWDVTCEVEVDAPESYTCTNVIGADEVSDHLYRCICEKAEEIAAQRAEAPRNPRTGCDCIATGDGVLSRAEHDAFCPLRLTGEEREAWLELEHRDART